MSSNPEIHHYIKNILQAVISYTNTAVLNQEVPTADTVRKLHSFIHVLSYIQDRVFEVSPLNFKTDIRADLVIQKCLDLMCEEGEFTKNEFPEMYCSVKRSTNLALITLEIISCLMKCGSGKLHALIEQSETGQYFLSISRDSVKDGKIVDDVYLGSELKLAGLIAKSDFNTKFEYETQNRLAVCAVFNLLT